MSPPRWEAATCSRTSIASTASKAPSPKGRGACLVEQDNVVLAERVDVRAYDLVTGTEEQRGQTLRPRTHVKNAWRTHARLWSITFKGSRHE